MEGKKGSVISKLEDGIIIY